MRKAVILLFAFCATVLAQEKFEIKNASKIYDVRVEVKNCVDWKCEGDAKFMIFKKGASKPFQVFDSPTEFMREEVQLKNSKKMYDAQSIVFFEDYNFDGIADFALRDGSNGGYGGPSYTIFLFDPRVKKFVENQAFTKLAQGAYLGMFEVDRRRKILRNFEKERLLLASNDGVCRAKQSSEKDFRGNRRRDGRGRRRKS